MLKDVKIFIFALINKNRSIQDSKGLGFKFLLGKHIWMSYLIYILRLLNYKIEFINGAG